MGGAFALCFLVHLLSLEGMQLLNPVPTAHAGLGDIIIGAITDAIQAVLGWLWTNILEPFIVGPLLAIVAIILTYFFGGPLIRLFWMVIYELVMTLATILMWIFTTFIEQSLDPAGFFTVRFLGGAMLDRVYNFLWLPIRDLTNVVLAFLLLIGAIMVVVKASKDFLVQYAPKFIIAIILVNFSWFISLFVLDVANIATRASFTLFTARCVTESGAEECKVITDIQFRGGTVAPGVGGWRCPLLAVCIRKQAVDQTNSFEKVTSGLVQGYGKILDAGGAVLGASADDKFLKLIAWDEISRVNFSFSDWNAFWNSISNFATSILIGTFKVVMTVFILIIGTILYLTALLALFVILLIRLPFLWLGLGLMPLVAVGIVLGKGGFSAHIWKIWEWFLAAAFMPAAIGLPLTAGFALMQAASNLPGPDLPLPGVWQQLAGSLANNITEFVIIIFSIIIMWMGVFMGIKMFDFTGGAVSSVGNWFNTLGKGAALAGGVYLAKKVPVAAGWQPLLDLVRKPKTQTPDSTISGESPSGGTGGGKTGGGGSRPGVDTKPDKATSKDYSDALDRRKEKFQKETAGMKPDSEEYRKKKAEYAAGMRETTIERDKKRMEEKMVKEYGEEKGKEIAGEQNQVMESGARDKEIRKLEEKKGKGKGFTGFEAQRLHDQKKLREESQKQGSVLKEEKKEEKADTAQPAATPTSEEGRKKAPDAKSTETGAAPGTAAQAAPPPEEEKKTKNITENMEDNRSGFKKALGKMWDWIKEDKPQGNLVTGAIGLLTKGPDALLRGAKSYAKGEEPSLAKALERSYRGSVSDKDANKLQKHLADNPTELNLVKNGLAKVDEAKTPQEKKEALDHLSFVIEKLSRNLNLSSVDTSVRGLPKLISTLQKTAHDKGAPSFLSTKTASTLESNLHSHVDSVQDSDKKKTDDK